jgi:tRNA threonylcarbamoyl adenosine modification protein (Sua5/YciO/YrdC/YwlC family)
MAQYFEVHPDNPQPRLLKQAAALLQKGGIVAVPTDSSYALVCHLDDKDAVDRLRRIRQVDDKHHLTLLCRDLSELANYARVDNRQYRLLKLGTPGPYTFILEATKEVPRRVSHPSRKTIGLRVPDRKGLQLLLELHGAPLLATTLIPAGETEPLNDPEEIRDRYEKLLDAIVDAGACPLGAHHRDRPHAHGQRRRPRSAARRPRQRAGPGALSPLYDFKPNHPPALVQKALAALFFAAIYSLRQSPGGKHHPNCSDLRPAGAVCHHRARGGPWLCGAPLWRQHRLHAGAHHAQPAQAHRPGGHHPDAAAAVLRHLGRVPVRLCQAGAGEFWQPAQPQAPHGVGGAGRAGIQLHPGRAVGVVLVAWWALGVDERFFVEMARAGVLVNLVMWAFNLFPLPPLDGGRILVGLLPWKQAHMVSRIEPWGFFIVMGLVIAGVVGTLWLRPLMGLGYSAINLLLTPLTALLR